VPSFTSSSSDRAPRGPGGLTWAVALLLAGAFLASAELFWRSRGMLPSVVDDVELWAYHRARIHEDQPKTLVLLGASRMKCDFSIATFRERFPDWRVVQLAVAGAGPVAALQDLAEDRAFSGVVICSVDADWLTGPRWDAQRPYCEHFHRGTSVNSQLNRLISAYLQSKFVVINPSVSALRTARKCMMKGEFPQAWYARCDFDRSRHCDFGLVDDLAAFRKRFELEVQRWYDSRGAVDPAAWLADLDKVGIEQMVRRIEDRSGRVIFVRLPTTGLRRSLEERCYPKRLFWDRFAAKTSAASIHFEDEPTLCGYRTPDMSHLEVQDTPRFTTALLDVLVRRGELGSEGRTAREETPPRQAWRTQALSTGQPKRSRTG